MFNRLVSCLDNREPVGGWWIPCVRRLTWCWRDHLDLAQCLERGARKIGRRDRLWPVELSVLFIALPLDLLVLLTSQKFEWTACAVLLSVWIVYRTLDIFLFSLGWVFVDVGRLHSVRRSLFGFGLNLVEYAFLSTSAQVIVGPEVGRDKSMMLLQRIVHLFTLDGGIFDTSGLERVVVSLYTVIGAFLLLVIVAGLAGSVIRRDLSTI